MNALSQRLTGQTLLYKIIKYSERNPYKHYVWSIICSKYSVLKLLVKHM